MRKQWIHGYSYYIKFYMVFQRIRRLQWWNWCGYAHTLRWPYLPYVCNVGFRCPARFIRMGQICESLIYSKIRALLNGYGYFCCNFFSPGINLFKILGIPVECHALDHKLCRIIVSHCVWLANTIKFDKHIAPVAVDLSSVNCVLYNACFQTMTFLLECQWINQYQLIVDIERRYLTFLLHKRQNYVSSLSAD